MKLRLKTSEIDRRRLLRGWLLRDLAEAAGLHANTVTKAVNGEAIGVRAARKLAAAFGAEIEELLEEFVEGPAVLVEAGAA